MYDALDVYDSCETNKILRIPWTIFADWNRITASGHPRGGLFRVRRRNIVKNGEEDVEIS